MRVYKVALLLVLGWTSSAAAQTEIKVEVSGGYSYVSTEFNVAGAGVVNGVQTVDVAHGWNAGVALFFNSEVAATGQVMVNQGTQELSPTLGNVDASLKQYMGGIRILSQVGAFEVGANILGGYMSTTTKSALGDETVSSVAVSVGGFLDLPLGHFGVRLIQADFVFASALLDQPAVRYTIGAFYRF